jgi:hypothetical protein
MGAVPALEYQIREVTILDMERRLLLPSLDVSPLRIVIAL